MTGMRQFTVICEWEEMDGWIDADELGVFASSSDKAERDAREFWSMTIGAKHPHAALVAVRAEPKSR
jgi:hypothetical protein